MTSDATILTFKSICNFIKDLNESFGKRHKSLYLYAALVDKTGIINDEPIRKHIQLFSQFCKKNEEAILHKDESKMECWELRYSEKVYIDMKAIFRDADREEKDTIWKHMIALLALLHPSTQAKSLLKSQAPKTGGKEEEFLSSLIDKVGEHIDPNAANPMDMMNGIMSSGVFQELVDNMNSGLSDGDLDLTKMLGSLQTMIGNINNLAQQGDSSPSRLMIEREKDK